MECPWHVFCVYVWDMHRRNAARQEQERAAASGVDREALDHGYGPPDRDSLRAVPWSGPGPDPLEELYKAEG